MTTLQRELLRHFILAALQASGACLPSLEVLLGCLRISGFRRLTVEEIEVELLYLADKGMAVRVLKHISPENSGWRITAAGRDHLAMEGLA